MKLTQKQIKQLDAHDWDVVENKSENFKVLKIYPDDGAIFKETAKLFNLTEDTSCIRLGVIATKETDE